MPTGKVEKSTPTTNDEEFAAVLSRLAAAAFLTQDAWLQIEQSLPHAREACPDFYEAICNLLIGTVQAHQTIEEAADEIVMARRKELAARERVPELTSGR